MLKRNAELVLSIIGAAFNCISIVFIILTIKLFKWVFTFNESVSITDSEWKEAFERFNNNDIEYFKSDEYEEALESIIDSSGMVNIMYGIGWFFVIVGIIGLVLSIIAILKLKSNLKVAGILLIISSVLSGLITIAGVLLMIAGIMCLVRKPKNDIITIQSDETGYLIE